ncbi:superoxide dismutase family protein [Qipengyuania sp. JC766]|uniref:superoxide dismutase family protein n=1 Tax=Qipengyuania sp. JC766 TaxID=3232139 RepID=UPI003459A143
MTIRTILAASAAVATLAGCTTLEDLPDDRIGSARIVLANGTPVGTAQIFAVGDEVRMTLAVTGLSAGERGFHVHETGTCTRPDFTSAGGHLNPQNNPHAGPNAARTHLGDLPNLTVGSSGSASTTVDLGTGKSRITDAIFDADGSAVVIHAQADDYTSQPSGDAGSRIACGVIQRAS